ncbi:MAG: octaprenyl diphosphate synthase [Burkholderiaceae bacterium]|nr:MAG: octaprenyl diphosphate synthase [Burkholderiaceae bacterium]
MQALDDTIRRHLQSEVLLINQISAYIVEAGGKRLRPALLLMFARALDLPRDDADTRHHRLAAIVELIHTATLLHDDVVDESELRRGAKTANAQFGNAASVLVGDFLYSRAFQMMVEIDSMRVMQVLSDATNTIAEGEVLQLLNCNDPDVDEARYLQVIRYKTAKLFEAAARLAAILANASAEVEEACAEYGRSVGTAFQLIDDVLDYSGSATTIGKNVGDDLREGKVTLPLIIAMQRGNAEQRATIRAAIEHGHSPHFADILHTIEQTGALATTREQARAQAEHAQAQLRCLAPSIYKNSLLELASFAVGRSN